MKITVFWTGYVGLITGTCLAEIGHDVMCIDIDEEKISNLKQWIIPIYEPGLEELVKKNYLWKKIDFSCDAKKWIEFGKVIFNAVGTPPDRENNNKADLKYVYEVAKQVGRHLNEYKLFINKSTVPVGTGKICRDLIKQEIHTRGENIEFDVASNPEFLREWNALYDFFHPDRIVLGIQNDTSKKILEEVYQYFFHTTPLIFTDIKSAEIIKYASNAFLATKISFINEIANFAEIAWWNIEDISKGMWCDTRIWKEFLKAWIGYGGSCFPKDIKALIETGKELDYHFQIIQKTEEVNQRQKTIVVEKLKNCLGSLQGTTITLWGLSFKPGTDDLRDAPSKEVIQKLLDEGVENIQVYDPISMENMKHIFPEWGIIKYFKNPYDALESSDGLISLTEWNEFFDFDLKLAKKHMRGNVIIDGRNIWIEKNLQKEGFLYKSIGKKVVEKF